jgi:hypothetical protein
MAKLRDGETGSVAFDSTNVAVSATESQIGVGANICRVNYSEPTNCILTVASRRTTGQRAGVNGQQTQELTCGDPSFASSPDVINGFVEVTYGSGSCQQRIVMDMRPGSYQLPPCQQVTVTAKPWFTSNSVSMLNPLSFDATVAPGQGLVSRRPTYTTYYSLTGSAAVNVRVPDYACYVDCWAKVAALGAGKPVLTLYPGTGGGTSFGFPSLIRDYTSGVWAPPQPAASFGCGELMQLVSTVTCEAWVQFELAF